MEKQLGASIVVWNNESMSFRVVEPLNAAHLTATGEIGRHNGRPVGLNLVRQA